MSKTTPKSDGDTSPTTARAAGSPSRMRSTNSAPPSSGSKRHWREPRTVKELSSQINAVASLVLNGEIDLRTAQAYSGLVRTLAATVSAEVSRARFVRSAPNLEFGDAPALAPGDEA